MARESELIRLEEFVEKLLGEFTSIKAEKQRLELLLREQQDENHRLQEALDSVDSERTDVCDRVTSIIARLERWEADLDGEASAPEPAEINPGNDDYLADPAEDEPHGEDDRGGMQGSLFSA
jgi:chromosome segregation ATPase